MTSFFSRYSPLPVIAKSRKNLWQSVPQKNASLRGVKRRGNLWNGALPSQDHRVAVAPRDDDSFSTSLREVARLCANLDVIMVSSE